MMFIDGGLLPEDFVTRCREESELGKKWWYYKLTKYGAVGKRVLLFGLDLTHINYRRRLDPDIKAKNALWSDAVFYFKCYFTCKVLIALYYQYAFDYRHYHLVRFDQMARQCTGGDSSRLRSEDIEAFRSRLVEDYDSARNASKLIGAPFMHANYGLPVFYLLVATLCPLLYFMPQYYEPIDIGVVRYFIQPPDEAQPSIDALIRDRVNSYILSSRMYNRLSMERLIIEGMNQDSCCTTNNGYKQISDARRRALWNHRFLAAQAKTMAYGGRLQPFDKRKGWQELGNICFIVFGILNPVSLLAWIAFSLMMPEHLLNIKVESDIMDWLFRVEMFVYTLITVDLSLLWNLLELVVCINHEHTFSRLCNLIDACIVDSTHCLANHFRTRPAKQTAPRAEADPSKTSALAREGIDFTSIIVISEQASFGSIAERINVSLLHFVLHYKIFVKQLRTLFEMLALWAIIALLLALIPAVILRLLTVYLSHRVRAILVLTQTVFFVQINIGLMIICRLHKRCLQVYNRLHGLMAHVIDMNRVANRLSNADCYDGHLAQVLRRELSHPEKLTERFSAKIPLVRSNITYESLLKYDFWWGVWAISILMVNFDLPNARDMFGGVWRFYSAVDVQLERFFSECTRTRQ